MQPAADPDPGDEERREIGEGWPDFVERLILSYSSAVGLTSVFGVETFEREMLHVGFG